MLPSKRRETGQAGEALAAAYLEARGYRIVKKNYRCPLGEIDLIAQEGHTLAFIEVKCRRSDRFGSPEAAVGEEKQKKISRCALYYLSQTGWQSSARFDVIAVRLGAEGPRIDLIRNAFDLCSG